MPHVVIVLFPHLVSLRYAKKGESCWQLNTSESMIKLGQKTGEFVSIGKSIELTFHKFEPNLKIIFRTFEKDLLLSN